MGGNLLKARSCIQVQLLASCGVSMRTPCKLNLKFYVVSIGWILGYSPKETLYLLF